MASIFLSYDRDDEPRARPLAALLERNGHKVWWDRAIKGGHEFGAEIEAALAEADKVVVLWSNHSVKSAWVRDEAAVGRDKGCLVPATIDGTPAPLGFRQFQTIDLSKWRGRGSSRNVEDLLNALDAPRREMPTNASKARRPAPRLSRPLLLGGAVFVAVAVAAILVWQFWPARAGGTPTFAIAPADSSPSSRQAAHDIAVGVANLSSNNAAPFEVLDATASSSAPADLVMSVGASDDGGRHRRDLSLRSPSRAILWSAAIDEPASDTANLPQQIAVTAQRALSCAAEALSYHRERIGADALKAYVSVCSNYDSRLGTNVDESDNIRLFEQVLAKAPHFQPAWAKLFQVEVDALDSVDDPASLLRKMNSQLKQTQQLGLDFGEQYAVKADALPSNDFLRIFATFAEGIKRHPDNAFLHAQRGYRLLYVGRGVDAVSDSTEAVQLDPLSPANQAVLALILAYSGNTDGAYSQLRKAEQLWPRAPVIMAARAHLDLRFGDPKEALALTNPTEQSGLSAQQDAFIRARIDPTPANIDRSIAEDRKIYQQYPVFIGQIVQTLGQFGRTDEALDILTHYDHGPVLNGQSAEVLFRPALRNVWRDPRSMAAAAHLGLLHYWKVSGNWPDFCTDPTLPYDCKKEAAKYRV